MKNLFLPQSDVIVPTGYIKLILRNVKTGKVEIDYVKNMFVTSGKNSLADSLRGTENNSKGIITYLAVGTSDIAPALSDTTLTTEIFRKLISVRKISDSAQNAAEFSTFFTTSEAIGTLREAGLFGDSATAVADSGTLFCKSAINRVKTSNDTLTLVWTVVIG